MTFETGALVFVTPAPGPSAPDDVNRATHNLLKSLTRDDLKRCIAHLRTSFDARRRKSFSRRGAQA